VQVASEHPSWVGWDAIVDAMCAMLQCKGFTLLTPFRKSYFGSCIIETGRGDDEENAKLPISALQVITAHNERVRSSMNEELPR
jgi:hypothetical protein